VLMNAEGRPSTMPEKYREMLLKESEVRSQESEDRRQNE
jgi:hypothetical protein